MSVEIIEKTMKRLPAETTHPHLIVTKIHWRYPAVFIVNFEYISTNCSGVSIVDFEQANAG